MSTDANPIGDPSLQSWDGPRRVFAGPGCGGVVEGGELFDRFNAYKSAFCFIFLRREFGIVLVKGKRPLASEEVRTRSDLLSIWLVPFPRKVCTPTVAALEA